MPKLDSNPIPNPPDLTNEPSEGRRRNREGVGTAVGGEERAQGGDGLRPEVRRVQRETLKL